jgi:phage tail sheath protein FI
VLTLANPPPSAADLHAARARRCATDMRREARALLELAEMVTPAASPDALTSIERATQWVVFEPNDSRLWKRVTRPISSFLTLVWRQGALFGETPEKAFYVKCDEETNPPETIDVGQLIVEIGLAPVKPAEFVIFRIGQWTAGAKV